MRHALDLGRRDIDQDDFRNRSPYAKPSRVQVAGERVERLIGRSSRDRDVRRKRSVPFSDPGYTTSW